MLEQEVTPKTFKALGDENRLKILRYIYDANREVTVSELQSLLGVSQPTLAHHMKILTTEQLVLVSRRSHSAFYTLGKQKLRSVSAVLARASKR